MEHHAEGIFINAAVTRWKRGDTTPVIFASHAHHMGMQVEKKITYHRTYLVTS